jgi:hypothetical protein
MNEVKKYLHCIDFSNKLKVLNLTSTATISSLLTTQLFSQDKRDNPMVIDIEKLRNCTIDEINGMSSPRMLFVFQRTILNSWKHRPLTPSEEILVRKGTLEIEFERGRRDYNYGAPSRLSCIYLMEDDFDSRLDLRNMFIDIFPNPLVVEVFILNHLELMKFDYRWIDKYYDEPKEEYIKNYWTSIPVNEKNPKWEYLLEGTIKMTNREQFEMLEDYVRQNHPDEYEGILLTREQLQNQNL